MHRHAAACAGCTDLFNHLVGGREQPVGNLEAERLCGLEIDRQLVLDRVLHRKVGRLLALEDAIDVTGRAPVRVGRVGGVGDEAAGDDEVGPGVDRRQRVPGRERDDQVAMKHRDRAPQHDQAAVRGAREFHDGALDLGRVAPADRAQLHPERRRRGFEHGELRDPAGSVGSRRTATRVTPGAMSRISSSHFPLMPYSIDVKPVALPPGCARLSTKPAPTGSRVSANTIGTVRVSLSNGPATAPPLARMTSGASASSSAAYWRMRSASPAPQRASMRTLPGTVQPACRSPCTNAPMRACPSASSAVVDMSTPTRRVPLCCARAACGYDAAAPPSSDRNWRRRMRSLRAEGHTWAEVIYHMSDASCVTAWQCPSLVKKRTRAVT